MFVTDIVTEVLFLNYDYVHRKEVDYFITKHSKTPVNRISLDQIK